MWSRWYHPALQSFGVALLPDRWAQRAEREFVATFVESPDSVGVGGRQETSLDRL